MLIHPLPAQLGRKYGRRFPAIRQALPGNGSAGGGCERRSRPTASRSTWTARRWRYCPKRSRCARAPSRVWPWPREAGYLVAITTELTDELRWEGYAREVARNIQVLRKDSGFEISDRIRTTVQSGPKLAPVWEHFGNEIASDTLSVSFRPGPPAPGAATATLNVDGEEVLVGVERAEG